MEASLEKGDTYGGGHAAAPDRMSTPMCFTFHQLNDFHILQIAPLRSVTVQTQIYCAMTADKQIL